MLTKTVNRIPRALGVQNNTPSPFMAHPLVSLQLHGAPPHEEWGASLEGTPLEGSYRFSYSRFRQSPSQPSISSLRASRPKSLQSPSACEGVRNTPSRTAESGKRYTLTVKRRASRSHVIARVRLSCSW